CVSMQTNAEDLANLLRFSNILIQQFPFFLKIRGLRGFAPFFNGLRQQVFFFIFLFSFFSHFFHRRETINR
ncbi:hypothetical protein, partial [Aerococcus urinaeequi]|uniref:hypothetical protein n=1 Tax=Aerococcus urinaeequi TaxID=51665 RepID=UPI003AAFFF90